MFQIRRYIIIIAFTALAFLSKAQATGKTIFAISGTEGDEPKILALYQNHQGYIFAGTTKGLYRFDGVEFYKYQQTLPDSPAAITAIGEVYNNQLWLGFEDGHLALLRNNHIEPLVFEEGYPKKPIRKILFDKRGIVWLATAGEGIYYLLNKRMYNINEDDGLSDNYVYDIAVTKDGFIKAGTDRGLNIISINGDKKDIKVFSSKNGLPDNILRCLSETSDAFSWLGMQDAGVVCLDNKQGIQTTIPNWSYGQVNDIIATSSQVFIATEDNGLLVYDHDDKNRITTASYHDEHLKKINTLFRDRESNIWVAGDHFLMRTAGSNIEMLYKLPKPSAEKIHSLLHGADKTIWFNTDNSVSSIARSGNSWQQTNYIIKNIDNTDISCLYQDKRGVIWIGTLGKGIILLDPSTGIQKIITEDSLLVNSNIISISGRDSAVWISGFEGIVCATLKDGIINFSNYTGITDIGNSYINYILPDSKGLVWFATDGKGLTVFDKQKFVSLQQKTAGLGNVIYRIVEDPFNNLWYSTYKNGVVKYDGKSFYNYTEAQGLSDMNITGLAGTRDNIIVMHRDKLDVINAKTGVVTYIDDEQGIGNINTDFNAYSTDNEGNLYFISDSTICRYHSSYYTALQPVILIDNIQLFLEEVQAQNGHNFEYDENNISFHYTGLYYSQSEEIRYQYKLEGYDKSWVDTKDKTKNFPLLPPGNYTFRVRVSLNNNFSQAPEASFMFVIEKPFWTNTLFILLSIAFALGAILLIIKSRERAINKFNKLEREKIRSQLETLRSQINPHFLFNSFNTLIAEIEEDPSTAVTYVEKLSDFYRSIVMNREKDLITLEEELVILNDYAFIQQKRYGRAVQITNTVTEEQGKSYYITPLALQLLIENAIKHNVVSLETPLSIEVYIDKDEYLVVKNTIAKKLQEEKGSRMGLQNIRKRYELISRRAVIVENDEQYFIVKIPLLKSPL
jgi:ligand-binding sensor domain-containing protein